jgi:NAD(P)-dependent dehydrogenase (short-subunit alcohol dehydrogenase family)
MNGRAGLSGRVALVTGASGGIGREIERAGGRAFGLGADLREALTLTETVKL